MRSIRTIPNLYASYWNYDKTFSEMFQSIKVSPNVMAKDYRPESKHKNYKCKEMQLCDKLGWI